MKITLTYSSDELELTGRSVIIRKRGAANAMASGLNGDREIAIRTITAVQLKLGGFMPGYILFGYAGSKPFRGGLVEATQDPDAFIFNKSSNSEITEFKKKLDELMSAPAAGENSATASSLGDELSKLAKLRSDGVLTEAEFHAAKAKLLS
jgi:hypothetical protein